MHASRLSLIFAIGSLAAACTPSSSEPQPLGAASELADLVVSGSCSHHEDTLTLAVAIANRGRGPAALSATRVDFNDDAASGVVRNMRFIAPHAVDTFEVELPEVCSKIACRWNITVDAVHRVHESGRC